MRIDGRPSDGIRQGLDRVNRQLESSFAKLASGKRITSAGDDASGLARAERLNALVESFEAATRNIGDGVGLARTGEAALGEVNESLGRMRELAVQASNGTLSDADRAALQEEFAQLAEGIDQVGGSTDFNGVNLFDGSQSSVAVQAGADAGETIDVELAEISTEELGLDDEDLSTAAGASDALDEIDRAIETTSRARASFGTSVDRLESAYSSVSVALEDLTATESRIDDADSAVESAKLAQAQILAEGQAALFTQANLSSLGAAQLLG